MTFITIFRVEDMFEKDQEIFKNIEKIIGGKTND